MTVKERRDLFIRPFVNIAAFSIRNLKMEVQAFLAKNARWMAHNKKTFEGWSIFRINGTNLITNKYSPFKVLITWEQGYGDDTSDLFNDGAGSNICISLRVHDNQYFECDSEMAGDFLALTQADLDDNFSSAADFIVDTLRDCVCVDDDETLEEYYAA